jgi:hypothetical protein
MRHRAIALGLVAKTDAPIEAAWLKDGAITQALLLNSLGCRPIGRCQDTMLETMPSGQAEALWRSLL